MLKHAVRSARLEHRLQGSHSELSALTSQAFILLATNISAAKGNVYEVKESFSNPLKGA